MNIQIPCVSFTLIVIDINWESFYSYYLLLCVLTVITLEWKMDKVRDFVFGIKSIQIEFITLKFLLSHSTYKECLWKHSKFQFFSIRSHTEYLIFFFVSCVEYLIFLLLKAEADTRFADVTIYYVTWKLLNQNKNVKVQRCIVLKWFIHFNIILSWKIGINETGNR